MVVTWWAVGGDEPEYDIKSDSPTLLAVGQDLISFPPPFILAGSTRVNDRVASSNNRVTTLPWTVTFDGGNFVNDPSRIKVDLVPASDLDQTVAVVPCVISAKDTTTTLLECNVQSVPQDVMFHVRIKV